MKIVERLDTQVKRRSDRIAREIPILLVGCDAEGKEFIERTKTVVLSRHGAGIVSMHKLGVEQELTLVSLESEKEVGIRIVGQIGRSNSSYTYGVAFLHTEMDFWGLAFAPLIQAESQSKAWHSIALVAAAWKPWPRMLSESDIQAIHGGVLRDCANCRSSTLWQITSGRVPDVSALAQPVLVLAADTLASDVDPAPAPFNNRRKHVRVRTNFTACIRNSNSEDDIVVCENISRGGLCFKTSRRYDEAAHVEVAAPYSPGAPCPLLPAQIVYIEELPKQRMFRCGVQYTDRPKESCA